MEKNLIQTRVNAVKHVQDQLYAPASGEAPSSTHARSDAEAGNSTRVTPVRPLAGINLLTSRVTNDKPKPLAVRICDPGLFEVRLSREFDQEKKGQLQSVDRIVAYKLLKPILPAVFDEIARIGEEQPNFHAVTELILNTLHAQCLAGMHPNLPPILMHGAPGVGKTRYVKRMAKALGLDYCDIPLAGSSDAFKISGLSRYWGTAGPGLVASTLADSQVANPVFLLDEIDKAHRSENGDPLSSILLLLEKDTAACFKDDFVNVPINASYASYLATANSIEKLPLPLLSRFICVSIEPLDFEGRRKFAETVYAELREQEGYGAFFPDKMPPDLIGTLAGCDWLTGRELKREILQAMQRACRDAPLGIKPKGELVLRLSHLRLPAARQPTRAIGFHA